MLEKRDRGRGADADLAVRSYGAARVHSRVEGAELLQVPRSPATHYEILNIPERRAGWYCQCTGIGMHDAVECCCSNP